MTNAPKDTLGSRIALVRGAMTQGEFAKLLGVGRNTLLRYEKDENEPTATFLQALVKDFGADPQWLLLGGEPPTGLNSREAALLDNYRHSPEEAKRNVETTAALLAQRPGKMKDTG